MIIAEPDLAQLADVLAIKHLAVSYAEAVGRDIDEAVQVYAPDGVLASPTTEDAVGPAAIAETIRTARIGIEFVFQTVHQGLVVVRGDVATARFPITEWARVTSNGTGMHFLGAYEDTLVRLPNVGWRFSRRELVPRTLARPTWFTGQLQPMNELRTSL